MPDWLSYILFFAMGLIIGFTSKPKKKTRTKKSQPLKILNPVAKGSRPFSVKSKRTPIVRSEEDEWAKEHDL